ncbi:hypothetical protein FLAG1_03388 [Fusarium langsethiae]|uniref:Uncharacterized protein n=1 Tax=Fusarium langsethiae TaxID=179993 RepID=A0A0N0DG68_FUSLA|nr:hypothetical protein FLAG1_03388 [Fusarium langsethiae]GKU01263.1 unnamed protein product [Fusarium langsethiae]
MADMEPFHQFYTEWGFIFERIIHDNCSAEYDIYTDGKMPRSKWYETSRWLGSGSTSANVVPLADCIINYSPEYMKAGMAAANVILGLTPAILSSLGSGVEETSTLFICGRRPFLALCLCLGSPGVPPLRLFEHRQLSQPLERRQGRLKLQRYSFSTETLILIAEYLIVFASIANVAQLGHEMGSRVVLVFAPHLSYLILLWLFIGATAHIFAALSLSLRVRIENEDYNGAIAGLQSWIVPWCGRGTTKIFFLPETLFYSFFVGFVSLLIAAHIIFGTLVFSSVLFISVRDCMPLIGRLMASVIVCRVVLMYEIAKLRHLCWAENPPLLTYVNPEDKADDVRELDYLPPEGRRSSFSLIPKSRRQTTFNLGNEL